MVKLVENPHSDFIYAECDKIARKYEATLNLKVGWDCQIPKDFNPAKPYAIKMLGWQVAGIMRMVLNLWIENELIFQCGGQK